MLAEVVLAAALWCWNPVMNADGYRFYWSRTGTQWQDCDRVEVLVPETCVPYPTAPEPLPGELIFLTVTAFNGAGESDTGWQDGGTHGPIVPCP